MTRISNFRSAGMSAAAIAFLLMMSNAFAQVVEWPQEISGPEGKVIVYQPQPEKLSGNVLTGRAAVSLELTGKDAPIFGAGWFTARIDTDSDSGIAIARDLVITKAAWPDSSNTDEQRFTEVVEATIPDAGLSISMERLSASLESSEIERKSLADLNTDPPAIVFNDQLAVLLMYDGEPTFADVEGSDYERAMNTPLVVVRNKKSKTLYLSSGVPSQFIIHSA